MTWAHGHAAQKLATELEGYDAADLEAFLDRAVHAAVSRCLVSSSSAITMQPGRRLAELA